MKRRTIEVVVQSQGDRAIMWSPTGDIYVAEDSEALGRWVIDDVWANDKVEGVEASAPEGPWEKLAVKALETVGGKREQTEERTAVHCVVSLDSEKQGVVFAPSGVPRIVQGYQELGKELMRIAGDKNQPRCVAATPRSGWADVFQGAGDMVVDLLKREMAG